MAYMLTFRLRVYLTILIIILTFGMIGLMVTENFTPLDAFYFLIVTIATVGYGDLHPITPAGKIIVIAIIITGVGCFVGVAANTIENMIDERERKVRLEKLNMIIGVFFSEVGSKLLKKFSIHDPSISEIQSVLIVSSAWSDTDFSRAFGVLDKHVCRLDSREVPLEELHGFLAHHKGFLLALLENPQLIEHDRFTPLLQALFHLTEELLARDTLSGLPETDYAHLSGDINRVYSMLCTEWLSYMKYLKKYYPYLFSLAMRTNPFDTHASPIVR
jgi:hypothetical protein